MRCAAIFDSFGCSVFTIWLQELLAAVTAQEASVNATQPDAFKIASQGGADEVRRLASQCKVPVTSTFLDYGLFYLVYRWREELQRQLRMLSGLKNVVRYGIE